MKATTPTPLRAISYGRVSTTRQADSGISLDDQEDTLAAAIAQRGWLHVEHVTDPGISGRKLSNRPGLLAAMDRLDGGEADVLVASKLDRLARSTRDFATMLDRAERKGWRVVVLDVNVDTTEAAGRFLVNVISAAAEFESRRIGERVKSSHVIRRAQGKRAGQPPVLPDAVRRRIVNERNAGRSFGAIAKGLTIENVPTAMGGTWWPATVRHVVQSVQLDEELRV